ncbi:MAG: hypothetical protein IJK35_09430 [Oscillospiraceae bacterium]|nr:hypothetical protein [Oscillospiraceae bacterium]
MDARITMLPVDPNIEKAMKRRDDFYTTCEKIRAAWDANGYTGDPIISLFSAIQGMSVYPP